MRDTIKSELSCDRTISPVGNLDRVSGKEKYGKFKLLNVTLGFTVITVEVTGVGALTLI